MTATTSDAT